MTSCFHVPKGFGGTRRSPDDVKRDGWREQGVLVVKVDDARLSWPEREVVRQIGSKLLRRAPPDEGGASWVIGSRRHH